MDSLFSFDNTDSEIKNDKSTTETPKLHDEKVEIQAQEITQYPSAAIDLPLEHKEILDKILGHFHNNTLHHATIFYGLANIGKSKLVNAITDEILASASPKGINTVHLRENNSHPDILLIKNPKIIQVDEIRKIAEFLSLKASFGDNKVIIIDKIDKLNVQAANAMLKMLEEPQNGVFFFILCDNLSQVMPTILSRTMKQYVPNANAKDFFLETDLKEIPLATAKILRQISNSTISTAKYLIGNNFPSLLCKFYDAITAQDLKPADVQDIIAKSEYLSDEDLFRIVIYLSELLNPFNKTRYHILDEYKNKDNIRQVIENVRKADSSKNVHEFFKIFEDIMSIAVNRKLFNLDKTHAIHCILILLRSTIVMHNSKV